jgi:c-di-GMP-binding flagellar brake protein YcgR|tara:strand:+ start:2940 stop:3188 length:249 start_codon:yes stop_codon:yes gene_type:complete
MATQEPVVMIDNKEVKVSELTNEQQYFHSQILDLTNKQKRIQFELDQVNASLSVFQNAFINSAKEKADKVLNNPKEDTNDDT